MVRLETTANLNAEKRAAKMLEQKWGVTLHHYGDFSPIDWWIEQHNEFKGVAEFKVRSCNKDRYPTCFLGLRKYLSLKWAREESRRSALFVPVWQDAIGWIHIEQVDASRVSILGRYDRGIKNDEEPIIEVPIEAFTLLGCAPLG